MSIYNIKPRLDDSEGSEGGVTPSPEFVKIEGKIYLVSTLPVVGSVTDVYKLLDGSLWSWYHNETEVINPVEVNTNYDLIYEGLPKDRLLEFLQYIKQEILDLNSRGVSISEEDFGNYELFTNNGSGTYYFPLPFSVYIENEIYTLKSTCYLKYNVENGELKDCSDDSKLYNGTINIKIQDYNDNDILFDFYYNYLNELSPEYVDYKDQKWLLVDGDVTIVSKEQLDILEFKLTEEWYNHILDTYEFDINLTELNFLLNSGTHTDVEEGYLPIGNDEYSGSSLDFNIKTGELSLLNRKGEVLSVVPLPITTALVSAVYDPIESTLTFTDVQGKETVVPLGSNSDSTFKITSVSELTPEFVQEHLTDLIKAMFLEDTSRSRIYTKVVGNKSPGTKFPFKLPAVFSINLVFAQPNIVKHSYNYILINKVTGEVTVVEGE